MNGIPLECVFADTCGKHKHSACTTRAVRKDGMAAENAMSRLRTAEPVVMHAVEREPVVV